MSWVGNGRENVFPWLLQDRGKQPGSGNPLSKAQGEKKEINWDMGGTQTERSADTVASWSARSMARRCWQQPTSQTQRPQRGTHLSCALFTNNADGQRLEKDGELPSSTHHCPNAGRPHTYIMTYIYSILLVSPGK